MGKKRLRKKITSKGIHSTVNRGVVRSVKTGRSLLEIRLNKIDAWLKGKNPWVTITNPSKLETNKPFIKVRANAYFGSPKRGIQTKEESIE